MLENKFRSRFFTADDSDIINGLYYTLTKRNRTVDKFNWEWINTWYGKGSSWLLFDDNRSIGDKLVGQYSVIPTPMVVDGNKLVAGKTENCMSHPDLRGKRKYFPHEKQYFQEAKKKYQAFFTTTGKGAPGRVRQKLGYISIDSWSRYNYFFKFSDHRKYFYKLLTGSDDIKKLPNIISKILILIIYSISYPYIGYTFLRGRSERDQHSKYKLIERSEANVNLEEIESFWSETSSDYKISIDRTKEYLQWRINDNPYHTHTYLLCYNDGGELVGFLIYYKDELNSLNIVDIISNKCEDNIFSTLLKELIETHKNSEVVSINCSILSQNILAQTLEKIFVLKYPFQKKRNIYEGSKADFYCYLSDDYKKYVDYTNPHNWYVTDLFSEGI